MNELEKLKLEAEKLKHEAEEARKVVDKPLGRRVTREFVLVAAFYMLYSLSRNLTGSAAVSEQTAYENALRIIDLEKALNLFHEAAIQRRFIDNILLMKFFDVFYGTAHFVVTIGLLFWLFVAVPTQYRFWRNVIAFTTAAALVGFATYPLLPPRLLPASYGFVDSLKTIGGLWNFESGPVTKVSNLYAAMPSLHFGWSMWCGLVLFTLAQRRWVRYCGVIYPVMTLFCIVVTANHYIIDAVGGAVVLGLGLFVARFFEIRRPKHPSVV